MPEPDRPNIVYIITDQQRYDHLGCNGHPLVRTPHIDRLASEGVCLDRFYTNHPLCTPSRACILTGRTPRSNRVYDNGCPLPTSERTLPQVLGEGGYDTYAVGKLHLTPWHDREAHYYESPSFWREAPPDLPPQPYAGFEATEICTGHVSHTGGHYGQWLAREYAEVRENWNKLLHRHPGGADGCFLWDLPPEAHADAWVADRACDYLNRRGDRPFFMHVGFPDPHHPYRAPEPWGSMYRAEDVALPNYAPEALGGRPPDYERYMRGTMNADTLGTGDMNTTDLYAHTEEMHKQILATTLGMVSFVDSQVGRILETLDRNGLRENTLVVFTTDHGDYMSDLGLQRKGPFLLEGLVRIPMIARWPAAIPGGQRRDALACHLDFMPTALEAAGVEIPRGVEGRSFLGLLRGGCKEHRERVLVEFLHQFMPDRNVKALVKGNWKVIVWGGQAYGELYDLGADPGERVNLWDRPELRQTRDELLHEMLDELLITENVLPLPPASA